MDAHMATILIVDDTPENLQVLGELLQTSYVVRAARSGQRALEVVLTPPRPDLILLDVMMPAMDGYQCLRHLRSNVATRDIPVVFLTALNSDDDERMGLDLGAVDFISKPFRPAILQARVRNHLEMKWVRDQLRDQNAFLEAEAERFLEILAHHLQEPVRRQVWYSQRLRRDLPTPPDEAVGTALAEIVAGAGRLHSLLHDIMCYLAVRQLPEPVRANDAEEALDAACQQVHGALDAAGAEVSHGPLPAVWLDRQALVNLFRALLDNAAAYRHPDRPPRVRVEAEVVDGAAVFTVTDNGVGIPPEYRERLFRVFERLQPDTSRSGPGIGGPGIGGTGIGLALVRKIAASVHGRAWIEDGEDGGTRVCVTLPTGEARQ